MTTGGGSSVVGGTKFQPSKQGQTAGVAEKRIQQPSEPESQQQQQQQQQYDRREEEYRAAQRAGTEAIMIGRETLEATSRQGEQLANVERMANETEYKLEKAGRMLRGMTWSGWVANMFSPSESRGGARNQYLRSTPPDVYENPPSRARIAAQAVQNYHANLKVLQKCETQEQFETCEIVCNNMHQVVVRELEALDGKLGVERFVIQLRTDLTFLRAVQQNTKDLLPTRHRPPAAAETPGTPPASDTGTKPTPSTTTQASRDREQLASIMSPENRTIFQTQESHLQGLSQNLEELGHLASSLSQMNLRQSHLVGGLDDKADAILEQQRMVNRRTDRLIQNKAWTPVKPTLQTVVTIRHSTSGKYLVISNGSVVLRPYMDDEKSIFDVWKRQGRIVGLKCRFNGRWLGQTLLGKLACNASSFGRREEWEMDDDWKSSRLLCASAAWGAGAYLIVEGDEDTISIGTGGIDSRTHADRWYIEEIGGSGGGQEES